MSTSPPLAAGTLCLYFSFDLAPIADWVALRARDAAAAVALACTSTGLLPAERVAARSLTAEGAVDIRAAQALPYDGPAWALGQAVRIEYLWSTTLPQMVVRIATRLAFSDGVTAVHLRVHHSVQFCCVQ